MTGAQRLWPASTDYAAAVQSPTATLAAPLKELKPVLSSMGLPTLATGQNAVVFLLADDRSGFQALRCFTTPVDDGRQRYLGLNHHLSLLVKPTALAPATWIDDGIRVRGESWPVVMMPWVEGRRLDSAVEDLLDSEPGALEGIADSLARIVYELQAVGIAHGDLQHGNIIVGSDRSITLVDLDGVWVSSVGVAAPAEVGHPNYQHPHRTAANWGPYVDTFSTLLIDVSLRALAHDPSLVELMGGENLVLGRDDLVDPQAPVWGRLSSSSSPQVRAGVARLAQMAAQPVEHSLVPVGRALGWPEAASATLLVPGQDATAAGGRSTVVDPAPGAGPVGTPAPSAPGDLGAVNWWDDEPVSVADARTIRADGPPLGVGPAVGGSAPSAASAVDWGATGPVGQAGGAALLRSGPGGSALLGVVAGLLGVLLYAAVEPALGMSDAYFVGIFIAIVSGMIGAAVLGWDGFAAGGTERAIRAGAIGFALAAGAAIVGLPVADLIVSGRIDAARQAAPAGVDPDAPIAALALAWALIAGLVGLVLGARQSARAAGFGAAAGAVAGLLGGLLHGATAASVVGRRVRVAPLEVPTLVATAVVAGLIGLAVAGARRSGALAVLTVMEGRLSGSEVLLKSRNVIGAGSSASLVLDSPGVLPEHVVITITKGRGELTARGPIQVNGQPVDQPVPRPLVSGDVLRVGQSYIRFTQRSSVR